MADEDPARTHPNDEDTFVIEYWGSFRKGVLVDELNHTVSILGFLLSDPAANISDSRIHPCPQFYPICKGWMGKHRKYHAFDQPCVCTAKCTARCAAKCRHRDKLLDGHGLWHSIVTRSSIRMFTDGKRTFTAKHKLACTKGERITLKPLCLIWSLSFFFLYCRSTLGYDVRSQLVAALVQDGKTVPGYLAIHAKDAHGRQLTTSALEDIRVEAGPRLWEAAARAVHECSVCEQDDLD